MLAVVVISALVGCDEDVVAVLGTDNAFSLYGVLSPQLDSQWVRVFPIEDRLEPERRDRLNAVFTSTDLVTGEEYVWNDSVLVDAFGQRAHVFWAPFVAQYDHGYRILVRDSAGAETTVTVSVPPRTEVVVQEPDIRSLRVQLPVLIEGDAPRVLRAEVEYSVGYRPASEASPTSGVVVVPYVDQPFETEDGWIVPVDLDADFENVTDSLAARLDEPIDRNYGIVLNLITLHVIVGNKEWNPPGGIFDANVLVQPRTLSNVENGFGFVGAGYRHEHSWLPDADVLRAAGFRAAAN